MGTKTGLNGITFGDATVQNTAAVTGVSSAVAGSGISVSAATGAVTFTNSGVTSLVAGSGISVSGATGAVTVTASGGGTVTSVATGNGLSGGTITSSGTLVVACPTYNSVGSYSICSKRSEGGNNASNVTSGTNYAAGNGNNQVAAIGFINARSDNAGSNILSGTWKAMTATGQGSVGACCGVAYFQGLFCRVS